MKKIYYIIHSNSFGDTLAATPTLRYLSKSHQSKINVVTHNKNVFNKNPYVETLLSFDEFIGLGTTDILKYESFTFPGQVDNNGIEKKFSHIDTRLLHSVDLGFQLTPEEMHYDFYPDPFELDVELPNDYVVLHTTTNWANRTWDKSNWQKLINWLSDNKIFTVLIGAGYKEQLHSSLSDTPLEKVCPHFENLYGLDLTNQGSISDMWWVIDGSKCIITMDSGPLHLAGCTDVSIIQLGSAINPKFRAPYRNGSQEYKYHYVGGTCDIFCNSNLLYNVLHWGDINHIPPQPGCLENKATFECHPQLDSVINKLNSILETPTENIIDTFFELYPKDDEGKIKYNFKKNTDDIVDIVVKDVSTGLIRDKITEKVVIHTGYLWWVPAPGSLEGLGDIDLLFYKNDNYIGKKRIHYNGGREIIVKGEKLSFDHLNGNNYSTFWEISINQDYDIQQNCLVDKDDVVLDIGANYGFFTLDSLSKGAKKIYSIEPYPEAFHHLVELSNKYPEIFPINKAVSSENGMLKFMVNKNTSAVNCLENHLDGSEDQYYGIDVESININTLLENLPEKVSFMKVDCEGAELELFQSITNTNLKKIQKVAIETHGDEIEQFVRQRLLENNFRVYKPNNIVFGINFN
jgi:FkbM family methyltransferase